MILLSFVVLVACVQILARTGNWRLAAGVFAAAKIVLALFLWDGSASILVTAALISAISFGYFWLLNRFEGTMLWWLVLVLGVILLG